VKKYLNKQDGKEKKMGLTRPKATQLEKVKKMKDKHFWASMIKSVMRIGACYLLFTGNIQMGAAGLALAEVVGIVEEMV
jgi:hypothetical protein